MHPSGFDRANTDSKFFTFISGEYHRRGTLRRKQLAQKLISHPFVAGLGMRVPNSLLSWMTSRRCTTRNFLTRLC